MVPTSYRAELDAIPYSPVMIDTLEKRIRKYTRRKPLKSSKAPRIIRPLPKVLTFYTETPECGVLILTHLTHCGDAAAQDAHWRYSKDDGELTIHYLDLEVHRTPYPPLPLEIT